MARGDRRFARVYYDDLKRDYAAVYADDALLASWLRLLVEADSVWPSDPELPRSVSDAAIEQLADAGLIALGPRYTYAIKGYAVERADRHAKAVAAANAKGAPSGTPKGAPDADPTPHHSSTTPRSPLPLTRGRRTNGTNPRATGANPRAQGTSPRQEIKRQKSDPTSIHDILERSRRQ
jgi:hypothetical protein